MPIEKSDKHKADNNKRILVAGDVLGKFTKFYQRLKVNFLSSLRRPKNALESISLISSLPRRSSLSHLPSELSNRRSPLIVNR